MASGGKRLKTVAEKLANHYLATLKSRNPRHQPWDANKPVEETRVFPHFVETAKIVEEVKAQPKEFIAAQFEWFLRLGKHKFPYPTQLHTDNARLRYIEYVERRSENEAVQARPEHKTVADPLKLERVKLRSMAKRFKMDAEEVLKTMPREFSRELHRQHGTWDAVKEGYED